jgi:SAM-dependent methyltransferase
MKEFEIRPRELFDAYLELSRRDGEIFFSDVDRFVAIPCPACQSERGGEAFRKHGFPYRQCETCGTLYVSPRPTAEMIDRFYRESASSKFWAERFFPETAPARRARIFRPRAVMIRDLLDRYGIPSPRVLLDIGSGYGLFLEEMRDVGGLEQLIGIEPNPHLARATREKGFPVIERAVEEVAAGQVRAAVAVSFEVFEHLFDPGAFLRHIRGLLLTDGLLIFTTLTVSGFDLQVLWDRSKSISPPHHLNFLTTEGLEILVRRSGFTPVTIATPGELDVDIVRNMLEEDPALPLPRFFHTLLDRRGPEAWAAFQRFLQEHRLSSHVRVVARATDGEGALGGVS